jgi:hypothetical protein
MGTLPLVLLSKQSFAETLIESLGIKPGGISTFTTPYRSGHSIVSILDVSMSSTSRDALRLCYQSLVGNLNCLLIPPDQICLLWYHSLHNIKVTHCQVIVKQLVMWPNILPIRNLWVFTLLVENILLWNHFFISPFHPIFYPCLMLTGVHRML